MGQLGGDVLAAIDTIGRDTFCYCGLSLGGMIGQWLGAKSASRIERLVLA
jgi:3-oxoadipate enol-lactonase